MSGIYKFLQKVEDQLKYINEDSDYVIKTYLNFRLFHDEDF